MDNSNSSYNNITILIPTLNESETIESVVTGFVEQGCQNILVIDGDSSDETQKIAREAGARVITQESSGKGAAVREALDEISTEYFVMIDGDCTYDTQQLDTIVEQLYAGYDEVLGNRFADMKPGAMSTLHKFGNFCINLAFFSLTFNHVGDLLTGYRGYKTSVVRDIEITEERFGIETEITTKIALSDYTSTTVPITYKPRPDGSEANLDSFDDGFDILFTLLRLRFTNFFN